jgi:predicted nucleic acid-binding Zn ribbon protein
MAILKIDRAPAALALKPRRTRPVLPRAWYSTAQAAAMLGSSERTLRRRVARQAWLEGVHYRWITRQSRRTLEINVAQVIKLMEACGWG